MISCIKIKVSSPALQKCEWGLLEPPGPRAHLPARARAHAAVALPGTWFSLANHREVSFMAIPRRLAGDQIAAPLKANSRLSEGVNISQRVASVLFIMNIFSLLSRDLPALCSHKTSPRPREGRLRLSSSPPAISGGTPGGFTEPRLPSRRGGCFVGVTPCSLKGKGHPRWETWFKWWWWVMYGSREKLQ